MLRAALFTITKIGKKPDLLLIDEHQNSALIVYISLKPNFMNNKPYTEHYLNNLISRPYT